MKREDAFRLIQELRTRGLAGIPGRGKRPAGPWATWGDTLPSLYETARLLRRTPASEVSVGVLTGRPSGVVVVDCDTVEGIAWADGNLPATPWRTRTPRGGEHRFYRRPEVERLPNRVGLVEGVDLRGDGGFVVAPGSDGYLAEGDWSVPKGQLPELPPLEFRASLAPRPRRLDVEDCPTCERVPLQERLTRAQGYARSASGDIRRGNRDETFFRVGSFAHEVGLGEDEILALFRKVNDALPLRDRWTEGELERKAHYVSSRRGFGSIVHSEHVELEEFLSAIEV